VARFGLEFVGRSLPRAKVERIVTENLATADMLSLVNRGYDTLSGGEQQRAQFARALRQLRAGQLIDHRQALFLDEPIASLDLCHQLALMDTARDITDSGVAVLAVLHHSASPRPTPTISLS
jgi:iron complex transport system ATP-binding protein